MPRTAVKLGILHPNSEVISNLSARNAVLRVILPASPINAIGHESALIQANVAPLSDFIGIADAFGCAGIPTRIYIKYSVSGCLSEFNH